MKSSRKKETETYVYFNCNPFGRITGDCCNRALSLFLNIDYSESVMDLAKYQCETGYVPCNGKDFEKYFLTKGLKKQSMPRHSSNKRYTVDEFCKKIAVSGKRYFVLVANHAICIKDKKVHDTWDSTRKYCGNYWVIDEK